MIKILITGRNVRIADKLYEYLNKKNKYELIQLGANRDNFTIRVPREMPHVIIACLGFESQRSIRAYNFLSSYMNSYKASLIILAKESDIALFRENCRLTDITFLPPENAFGILEIFLQKIQEAPNKDVTTDDEPEAPDTEEVQIIQKDTRKRVLIVENNPDQLMKIRDGLKDDFAVSAVRTGAEALNFLENHHSDLILLDYSMPDMDGPTTLKRIRAIEKYASLPIVFLADVTDRLRVIDILVELKPQGYIIKTTTKKELVEKITEILKESHKEKPS